MGALHAGSCVWSARRGVVLGIPQALRTGGGSAPGVESTLVYFRAGGVSAAALPVAVDWDTSWCGWPPIGGSFLTWILIALPCR